MPNHKQDDRAKPNAGHRLMVWVVAAFAIQAVVWTGWLVFAARHRVADVPLATASRGSQ